MNAAAEINRNQPSVLGMHMNRLGESAMEEEFQQLLLKLRDRDWHIRAAAAEALAIITGHFFGTDYERWAEWWRKQQKK